jgi:hypothetical protein
MRTTPASTTPAEPRILAAAALERVGEALVDARQAVVESTSAVPAQDALVALCRASYDALTAWEAAEPTTEAENTEPVPSWRTPLDELRVQTALAEMELRDAGVPLTAVRTLVSSVTERLEAARQDIGAAVEGLRSELRRMRA